MNVENRTIFEGDNLHILRGLDAETIDLIYLDPPFNSTKTYEAPIASAARRRSVQRQRGHSTTSITHGTGNSETICISHIANP